MSRENRRDDRSTRRTEDQPSDDSSATAPEDGEPEPLPRDDEPEALPKDDVFHLLQTRRRRDAARYLLDADGQVEMRDLAEQVAAWENDTTVQQLSSDERQRVYISLYQSHLPKLDQEGVIEYDQSRGTVRATENLSSLEPYLEDEEDDSPGRDDTYHVGAIGVSAALLFLVATGPIAISGLALGAIITGLFLAATTVTRFR